MSLSVNVAVSSCVELSISLFLLQVAREKTITDQGPKSTEQEQERALNGSMLAKKNLGCYVCSTLNPLVGYVFSSPGVTECKVKAVRSYRLTDKGSLDMIRSIGQSYK